MSSLLESAFNRAANLAARKAVVYIERVGKAPLAKEQVEISMSNYVRDSEIMETIVQKGFEFVITKENLLKTNNYTFPKRSDVIHDPELGTLTIELVKPLIAMGVVIGWRIQTG